MEDIDHICDYGCGQIAKFRFKNGKYCCSKNSSQCPNIRRKKEGNSNPFYGKKHSDETKKIMSNNRSGKNNRFYGKKHTDESKKAIGRKNKGKFSGENNPNYGKERDKQTRKKISETRVDKKVAVGNNNPNWKDGKTFGKRKSIMETTKYKEWRRKVFERDNNQCVKCGRNDTELHAHHKKSYKDYPELIYDVENGETLCIYCHREVHKK